MTKILNYLKAVVGLVLAALTWYLATYPTGADIKWVSLGVAVLTGAGVAVTTNTQKEVTAVLDHTFPDPNVRGSTT